MEKSKLTKIQNKLTEVQMDLDVINGKIDDLDTQIADKSSKMDSAASAARKVRKKTSKMIKAFKLIVKALPTEQELRWYQEFITAFQADEIGEPRPDGGRIVTDVEHQNIKKIGLITELLKIFHSVETFIPAALDYDKNLQDDWKKENDALEKLIEEGNVLLKKRENLLITQRMLLFCEELFTE